MSSQVMLEERGIAPELLQRINNETGKATGLPNLAYTSPAFFDQERRKLFAETWTCLGQACTVPAPGDVVPVNLLGVPLIMVRDAAAEIRVFHNVCSHRGNELVWEACSVRKYISCPYHGWTYDLEGNLRRTPHIGGTGKHETEGFTPDAHGLRPVRAAVWLDLVFVNLSETAPPVRGTHRTAGRAGLRPGQDRRLCQTARRRQSWHPDPGTQGKLEALPGEQSGKLSPALGAPGSQRPFQTKGPLSLLRRHAFRWPGQQQL